MERENEGGAKGGSKGRSVEAGARSEVEHVGCMLLTSQHQDEQKCSHTCMQSQHKRLLIKRPISSDRAKRTNRENKQRISITAIVATAKTMNMQ
jgi:hypothetical protein